MDKTYKYEASKDEKKEMEEMVWKALSIHKYLTEKFLNVSTDFNTDVFFAVIASSTRDLVRHSVILAKLTRWLKWLTVSLFITAVISILVALNATYTWF